MAGGGGHVAMYDIIALLAQGGARRPNPQQPIRFGKHCTLSRADNAMGAHTQWESTVYIETLVVVDVAPRLNSSFRGKCLRIQSCQPVLDNGARG